MGKKKRFRGTKYFIKLYKETTVCKWCIFHLKEMRRSKEKNLAIVYNDIEIEDYDINLSLSELPKFYL